jgi:membrane protein YdbS with pleckstrin-like domain
MNDDFIRSLQADWQSQENDADKSRVSGTADKLLRRLHRNRWTPQIVLGVEILNCALAFAVGLWFAWHATHDGQHRLLFALSAGVLLAVAPALGIASFLVRRPALAWDVETPESLLNVGIRRAESSLRAIRIGRWHVGTIAAFVLTLWIAQMLGFIDAFDFLIVYSLVCLVFSVAGWRWMRWRENRVRSERAACVRLLAALQVDNGMVDSG